VLIQISEKSIFNASKTEVLNFFGITRDVLSNIELQKYVATDKHVYFLANALKVEIAELFRP